MVSIIQEAKSLIIKKPTGHGCNPTVVPEVFTLKGYMPQTVGLLSYTWHRPVSLRNEHGACMRYRQGELLSVVIFPALAGSRDDSTFSSSSNICICPLLQQ
jgi:hypothetical protein